MRLIIFIICFILNVSLAKEVTKNINISATIFYNCEVIDIKITKYCGNAQITQENNTIIIK